MAKPFSEETQGLLERAQLAIDRAARLRDQTRRSFREAQFKAFRLELTVGGQRSRMESKYAPFLSRPPR